MKRAWIASLFLLSAAPAFGEGSLPKLNIDPQAITISGVSSGAYMAIQMQVAYSGILAGAASVAGGTYWCAEGDKIKAQINCMGQPGLIRPEVQINEARRLSKAGQIDSLANLAAKSIYIYASSQDQIIKSGNSDKLVDFLASFVDRTKIVFDKTQNSGHGFPTLDYGAACDRGMSPWLLKCRTDLAGKILNSLHGPQKARGTFNSGRLRKFSQTPFGDSRTPLFAEGWIYVPSVCEQGEPCKLHVALHGCQMNPDFIQDQFAVYAGFNEWADTNATVVLYPQSAKVALDNPYACWDWFGFTGKNYVTKSGPQMTALRAMIREVSGL